MEKKDKNKNPSPKSNPPIYFILATVCVIPFALALGLAAAAAVTKEKALTDLLYYSAFFLPVLILAAIAGILFIIISWKKGPRRLRGWLIIYFIIILL